MNHNKQVVQDFLIAVGQGDADTAGRLMTHDATWEVAAAEPASHPLPRQTREQFLEIVGQLRTQFLDGITYDIHTVLAGDDWVVIEATCDAAIRGIPYRNRYNFVVELRDGLVVHGREYMDFAYFKSFQQRLADLQPDFSAVSQDL